MDDEEDVAYLSSLCNVDCQKFPFENAHSPQNIEEASDEKGTIVSEDQGEEEEEEEEDEGNGGSDDDEDDGGKGSQRIGKDDYELDDGDEHQENEDYGNLDKHPKKKKLKALVSSYEFVPRAVPPSSTSTSIPKPSYGGRNPLTDWNEHETFTLLDAWGDKFLKQGRKSLRSEEWHKVAEKVSHESKIERTDTQCRNRLDTLKKKYKKEKQKEKKLGDRKRSSTAKWIYFKKMDTLLSSLPQASLPSDKDSGESIFTSPKVYPHRSNGLDEMRESPRDSESAQCDEGRTGFYKMLSDSFDKFSEIYEKVENGMRRQMVELEQMRKDFYKDLELQKRQILERGQAEIAKIWRDDEENTASAKNGDFAGI